MTGSRETEKVEFMLSWSDQPKFLENAPVLAYLHVTAGVAEVRVLNKIYYVTVGNLFSSQTLHCADADTAFRVLDMLDSKRKSKALPAGAHPCT